MLELEINAATQYATAYQDGKPVATLQRRRTYDAGPRWKVYDRDGVLLFDVWSQHSPKAMAARIERTLAASEPSCGLRRILNAQGM